MAFHNEIGAGRYNRAIQKLLNMKGGPPARQLATDMMFVFPVLMGAEVRAIEGWNRFAIHVNQTPNAGVLSGLKIRNPGVLNGAGVVAVIEKMQIENDLADTPILSIGADAADYSNVARGSRLDNRGNPNSTCIVSNQSTASTVGTNIIVLVTQPKIPIDLIFTDIQELPLAPGDSYNIANAVVNNNLRWNLIWRERPLEDSELTRIGST